jgi:hypothetical protein
MQNVRRYIDFLKDVENSYSYIERALSYLEGLKNQEFERWEDRHENSPTLTEPYQDAYTRLTSAKEGVQAIIDRFVHNPYLTESSAEESDHQESDHQESDHQESDHQESDQQESIQQESDHQVSNQQESNQQESDHQESKGIENNLVDKINEQTQDTTFQDSKERV